MKVISVIGFSGSGKTTTIEGIIKELRQRGYSVGSAKEIHYNEYRADKAGTNTFRHQQAGAEIVTALGPVDTNMIFPRQLTIQEVLRYYTQDFVVLEGVTDINCPKIVTGSELGEFNQLLDGSVIAIAGRIAATETEYKGIPIINGITEIGKLVDLIEQKVFPMLPDFPQECCDSCGSDCRTLTARILAGTAKHSDCVLPRGDVRLWINDVPISMVPFVQRILKNAVEGVVKELSGFEPNSSIKIQIGD